MSQDDHSDALIDDEAHGLSVRVPTRTAAGSGIELDRVERDGMHRLHARSSDGSTVYVEILSYPERVPHQEAVTVQQAELRQRAPGSRLGEPSPTAFLGRPSTEFDFEGTLGSAPVHRRFVFVDTPARTVRIVYDPDSPTNAAILATLRLEQDEK